MGRNANRGAHAIILAAALGLGALSGSAWADEAVTSIVKALDPVKTLPPPPAPGSADEAAELDELRGIMQTRTTEQLAKATWDDAHEDPSAFVEALGPTYDLKSLPQTAKLLEITEDTAEAAAGRSKKYFKRLRPYRVDNSINGCNASGDSPNSSYPSGHATIGWSLAVVLADLAPERSEILLARALDFNQSRMICGSHFRRDTEAGRTLGTLVAQDILLAPEVKAQLDAAKAEMAAARSKAGVR